MWATQHREWLVKILAINVDNKEKGGFGEKIGNKQKGFMQTELTTLYPVKWKNY